MKTAKIRREPPLKGGFLFTLMKTEVKVQDTNISYRAEIAREHGIAVAILLNNIKVFSEYHEQRNDEYWHSMKDIAEVTGLSKYQVAEAAKKAKELGIIDYRQGYKPNSNIKTTYWTLTKIESSEGKETKPSVGAETETSLTKSKRDKSKRSITNVIGETPEVYGKPEINELFEYWHKTIGFPISSNKQKNRYACNNLIKNHGIVDAKRLVDGVERASNDKYAPRIADFIQLQSKLNDLLVWGKKQSTNNIITEI